MPVDELHFVVETLGDPVVAGEPPHGDNLFGPGSQSLTELDQLRQAGLAQLVNGPQKAGHQSLTLLAGAVLAAFFPFFYENYFTLQKFVRGLVAAYYFSLVLMLGWPHPLGTFLSVASFVIVFSLRERTVYYPATVTIMIAAIGVAIYLTKLASRELIFFAALGVLVLGYLQTFIGAAYDIRRAGNVSMQRE